ISEGHAKCLAGLSEHSEQLRFLKQITEKGLSVRELESFLSKTRAPGKRAATKAGRNILPEVKRYEEALSRFLGRRVQIQTSGKKGWLKLEFYTPEDLDRLCDIVGLPKHASKELSV